MLKTCRLCKDASPSSNRWLARQRNDPFAKSRQIPNAPSSPTAATRSSTFHPNSAPSYRSRSAFKLLGIATRYPTLFAPARPDKPPRIVIDLGAAPGGWSQVSSYLLGTESKTLAVDLLPIHPIAENVECIQGDFLTARVQLSIHERIDAVFHGVQMGGTVDLVMSDMMGQMSGVRARDVQMSLQLCESAWEFGKRLLRRKGDDEAESSLWGGRKVYPGGNMILKFFAHPDLDEFKRDELDKHFAKVVVEKPDASRKESSEAYWVCLGYKG